MAAMATYNTDAAEHDAAVALRRKASEEAVTARSPLAERLATRVLLAEALICFRKLPEAWGVLSEVDRELSTLSLLEFTLQSNMQVRVKRQQVNELLFTVACLRGECAEAQRRMDAMFAGLGQERQPVPGRHALPHFTSMSRVAACTSLAEAYYTHGQFAMAERRGREAHAQASVELGSADTVTISAATVVALSMMAEQNCAEAERLLKAAIEAFHRGCGEHAAGLPGLVHSAYRVTVLEQLRTQIAHPGDDGAAPEWVTDARLAMQKFTEENVSKALREAAQAKVIESIAA
jgi:hypothetical protein